MATASVFDEEIHIRAQDVKRCHLCPGKDRKSNAELVCNSCGIELCKQCVGQHITEDQIIKHEVVPFKFKNLPLCKHHQNKCEYFCSQCDIPLCSFCLSSGSHAEHNFDKIADLCNSKFEELREHVKLIEEDIEPKFSKVLYKLDKMISSIDEKHKDREIVIKNFEKELHSLVDNVMKKYHTTAKQYEKEDIAFFDDIKSTMKEEMRQIQETKQQCLHMLHVTMEEFKSLISFKTTAIDPMMFKHMLPKKVTVPDFEPAKITEDKLFRLIGTLPRSIREDTKNLDIIHDSTKSVQDKIKFYNDGPSTFV
ncbi:E3 ubiquitin-protein ligase TRIM9-like [Saccostrea cucullata]|uniref:E3 ubiquitin-protein ligase TRIM9-like n=1 Tax=Saccostrea cuccullata TaxID=36930 RepID=UPI002ED4A2CA